MSQTLHFRVEKDTATPALNALMARVGGKVVHEAISAAMLDLVQAHFRRRNAEPNQIGGPKTGFWEKIASGTHASSTETSAVVTIPAPILQKLNGGTIRPVRSKALAFPISPNSYGKTAREMRLTGQTKFVPLNRGNVVGIIVSREAKGVVGEALFLVVRKVTQAADPNAIPPMDALAKAALDVVEQNARVAFN